MYYGKFWDKVLDKRFPALFVAETAQDVPHDLIECYESRLITLLGRWEESTKWVDAEAEKSGDIGCYLFISEETERMIAG